MVSIRLSSLASVAGAADLGFGLGGFGVKLGIVVQLNVCAVCTNVRQENAAKW
jgi:hypothetical protein